MCISSKVYAKYFFSTQCLPSYFLPEPWPCFRIYQKGCLCVATDSYICKNLCCLLFFCFCELFSALFLLEITEVKILYLSLFLIRSVCKICVRILGVLLQFHCYFSRDLHEKHLCSGRNFGIRFAMKLLSLFHCNL